MLIVGDALCQPLRDIHQMDHHKERENNHEQNHPVVPWRQIVSTDAGEDKQRQQRQPRQKVDQQKIHPPVLHFAGKIVPERDSPE